ncbi:metalloproteinase inhibitor 3-like [Mytilus edulis]|uniref:metalloproteinase inhibitor 3-like n=1 Tax=Mytilus edulis TaxID=6550 RepID=UPI0039EF5986
MRTMMYASFLLICWFAISEQSCLCSFKYAQQHVCYSPIVVELKIDSYSENAYDRNYQISATKFYKGKGKYDTLANKTTLETPKDFTVCGPVDLEVGSSYILSVSIHNGKMHNNDCDLKVEASKATNTMLEGLAGKYEENCDCDIPTYFDGPIMFRSKKQCGTSYCDNRDVICARDDNDQCNWSNC